MYSLRNKKLGLKFAVYMDDLDLITTLKELLKTIDYLKKEIEMKDLGKVRYCLGLQIEYYSNDVFVH